MNDIIFKAYDVRGIYPEELNEEAAFKIGFAFASFSGAKEIAVGRDMRISSPQLFNALAKGIFAGRTKVLDLGLVPVEMIYFAVGGKKIKAGVMITASHNPKECNGFKFVVDEKGTPKVLSGKDLGVIAQKVEVSLKDFKQGPVFEKADYWNDYFNHLFSLIDKTKIKNKKVVVDAGSGMAGKVIPMLEKMLPIKIIPLNFNLDGNFPAHPSNPLEPESGLAIKKKILKTKADFGFIFDGDSDRIFLVDEKGEMKKGDISLLLLARYFLAKNPGKGIAYNLICSKAVPEFIEKWGGRPIRTKVGFVNVQRGIFENNGVMGGEIAGHFSFKDYFYCDSGFLAFLVLLEEISKSKKKVSGLVKELSPYFKNPEMNFKVKNKEKILEEIKKNYSDGKQDFLDGITVEYSDWWFNVRPSNTEPLLRITIEAKNKPLLEQKKKELVGLIEKMKDG